MAKTHRFLGSVLKLVAALVGCVLICLWALLFFIGAYVAILIYLFEH